MTKKPRTRTPSAGMEAALLQAAADILETEGPDALSVRRIAAAAGVAPMGVYNHFESKSGIIEALFIQGFERLSEALQAVADVQDPYEALREGGRRYRALALEHPMVYQLMFLRAVPGFEPSDHAFEIAGDAFANLATAVERAMAAGVIAEGVPSETAQLIWSSIHGWVSLELMGMTGFVEDQNAGFDRVCSTMLDGLSPEAVRHSAAAHKPESKRLSAGRAGPDSSATRRSGTTAPSRRSGTGSSRSA